MNERNDKGQFAQGNQVGPGRPTKARELAYLAVLTEEVTLDDWRKIVRTAKKDATAGEDGKTREFGRRFIADYAIGKPKQTVQIGQRDTFNEFADVSDEELNAIIAAAESDDRASAGDSSGADPQKS
jgi:hypothetical protein